MNHRMLVIHWTNSSFDSVNICGMNFGFSVDSSIQHLRRTVLVRDILPICSKTPGGRGVLPYRYVPP